MQLLAVLLARLTVITQLAEWDPRGKSYLPDFIKAIVARYDFQQFPKTVEEYSNVSTGAVFGMGKFGDIVINSYSIYSQGLVVDTRSSTDDSEKFLKDVTEWFSGLTGAIPSADKISGRFYLSQLSFRSEANLDAVNPKLCGISAKLTEKVSAYAGRKLEFQTTGISFQFEAHEQLRLALPLRIERLEGSQFAENKYFSQAPLPTQDHIRLLEDFETILQNQATQI